MIRTGDFCLKSVLDLFADPPSKRGHSLQLSLLFAVAGISALMKLAAVFAQLDSTLERAVQTK